MKFLSCEYCGRPPADADTCAGCGAPNRARLESAEIDRRFPILQLHHMGVVSRDALLAEFQRGMDEKWNEGQPGRRLMLMPPVVRDVR